MTDIDLSHLSLAQVRDLHKRAKEQESLLEDQLWEKTFDLASEKIPPVALIDARDENGAIHGVGYERAGETASLKVFCCRGKGYAPDAVDIHEKFSPIKLDSVKPSAPIPITLLNELLQEIDKGPCAEFCEMWAWQLKGWLESQPYFNWPPSQETQQEGNRE